VALLLADSLPAPPAHLKSPFRFSFHYDANARELFVRKQRAEDAGEFVLVLAHALAHVGANQWDARLPAFQKELFAIQRVLCRDLFATRSGAPAAVQNASDKQGGARTPKQVAARVKREESEEDEESAGEEKEGLKRSEAKERREEQRMQGAAQAPAKPQQQDAAIEAERRRRQEAVANVSKLASLGDVLDARAAPTGVSSDRGTELTAPHRLMTRMDFYSNFTHNAALRAHLQELEGEAHAQDFRAEFARSAEQGWDYMMGAGAVLQGAGGGGEEAELKGLHTLCDSLTGELLEVVDKMVQVNARIAEEQQRVPQGGAPAEEKRGADELGYEGPGYDKLALLRVQLGKLESERKALGRRLHSVQEEIQRRERAQPL
jgi:hypothetical protein